MKTAFFDFDDTLTVGDTLPLWLAALRGWPLVVAAYAVSTAIGWAVPGRGVVDNRGRIKAMLLRLLVRGLPADRAATARHASRLSRTGLTQSTTTTRPPIRLASATAFATA